jgi:hypothetical protein
MWVGDNVAWHNNQSMHPGSTEADDADERTFGSMNRETNLVFYMELLRGALVDGDGRAKAQSKHQAANTNVLGDKLHETRVQRDTNPVVFTYVDDSAWDAILTLHGKQDQFVEGIDELVKERVRRSLSLLATIIYATIKVQVDDVMYTVKVE